jgi:hypothetical protein
VGLAVWGLSSTTLDLVVAPRPIGIGVLIAQYPYSASSWSLSVLSQPWALADGDTAFARRVADPALRDVIVGRTAAGAAGSEDRLQRFFTDLYGNFELAYRGRVLLFREDGVLVATVPGIPEHTSRNFSAHPLFAEALKRADADSFQGPSFIDPDEWRLIVYRRVKGEPLVVTVSTPMSEILHSWWRDAAVMATAAGAVISISTRRARPRPYRLPRRRASTVNSLHR